MRLSQRLAAAFHEAGHAFQAVREGAPLKRVTLAPGGEDAGPLRLRGPRQPAGGAARGSVERHARVCLAGPMAQHRFNPRSMGHYRSHSDYALARGLALRLGGAEVAEAWLRLWEAQVREDLAEGWPAVERLAAALLERGTVSGEEAGRLVLARAG